MSTTDRDTTYNGWKNYETWNVALWLNNDEGLQHLALETEGDYSDLAELLNDLEVGSKNYGTPDGVTWNSDQLDLDELNEMLKELREENR